jgi:hypothetical protein
MRLGLYRSALNLLARQYRKYAFFDTVSIPRSQAKLIHVFRDSEFESELKRMHLLQKERMILREGIIAREGKRRKSLLFFKQFCFEDILILDIDGQRVTIRRGDSCSFEATRSGSLKQSAPENLLSQYQFTDTVAAKVSSRSISTPVTAPKGKEAVSQTNDGEGRHDNGGKQPAGHAPRKGPLFGEDPLLRMDPGYLKDPKKASDPPIPVTRPALKRVAGAEIDESF